MKLNGEALVKLLIKQNYLSKSDAVNAQKLAIKHRADVLDVLLSQGLVTNDLCGQAVAEALGLVYADLNSNLPDREQVLKISEELAKKFRVVLFKENKKSVVVTTDNPENEEVLSVMEALFAGKKVTIQYSLPEDIDNILMFYRKSLETRFAKIIDEQKRLAPEIIEQILSDALSFRASDVHFEPQIEEVVIRFRVDGVLQEAGRVPKNYYENILNRIKVQSRLRIDEHFATQDGAMNYSDGEVSVDIRVSVAPMVNGEKVVLRLLSSYIKGLALADLGLSPKHQEMVELAANKPFGMILVTGPTGSGKTTTLYSLIRMLNQPGVNITTIEDPVEYKIKDINQIQVNHQTELTFAKGLRSIMRQDPDIILVGEIRDEETAEIAVNAALTGHLLLSAFHANDAAGTIPRLLSMKNEPFLLASTLELIIAQRLVRKICDHCRYSFTAKLSSIPMPIKTVNKFFGKTDMLLYKGKGCSVCGNSGYLGRTAIFELIALTSEMKELILKEPSAQEIWSLARKQGSATFFEDGIDKVKQGVTTIDELKRVAEVPLAERK
ncbi:hypothetical protein COT94_02325 [Candidatus Falkowbacteria bacterium CG10_big_fil_rev_8_21_14_0_10_37_14]|uniref:Bacterial type II secretion system protein E domain-containing protein n=1 Tax=Candidatus Falkowbacteria bacterium CG10_big_fil_rev_8_21_14_0_10_37_14 TaxID=1974561 RepID=A0A2M6WTN9_9BACT|nr:MAG: hypothetical protein COT94_02325 [Candidatus Falkowbacteria bacterium CG10_big_fil_rev_8_21_14_0_10_37_14]